MGDFSDLPQVQSSEEAKTDQVKVSYGFTQRRIFGVPDELADLKVLIWRRFKDLQKVTMHPEQLLLTATLHGIQAADPDVSIGEMTIESTDDLKSAIYLSVYEKGLCPRISVKTVPNEDFAAHSARSHHSR